MSAGVFPLRKPTPLQVAIQSLFDLLEDERETLNDAEWSSFVFIACERIGALAAREVVAEALRATDEAAEDAA